MSCIYMISTFDDFHVTMIVYFQRVILNVNKIIVFYDVSCLFSMKYVILSYYRDIVLSRTIDSDVLIHENRHRP